MSSIFDILGPIMVGPSSSHTAGAVRIGYTARQLFGEPVKKAEVYLHGSFAATGEGHGTDKAIIAGLLGMKPDGAIAFTVSLVFMFTPHLYTLGATSLNARVISLRHP